MGSVSGLDAVEWASLYGTYGSAEDVPGHIEALRSPEPDIHRHALQELGAAVVHQGTRWQVSSHVVPFLVLLIDDPATPNRGALAQLLRWVGLGHRDDRDLPFDAEREFSRFDAQALTPEQEATVVERVYLLQEEFTDDWVHVADACTMKWDADAYRAAAAHVDAYRRWLANDDPEVGSRSAELLAWFPPSERSIAALLSAEGNHHVRASANLAIAHLDVAPDVVAGRLTSMLEAESLVVRVTAAIGLAYRLGRNLPDRALDILVEAKESDPLPDFPPGWRQRAQHGFVTLALQRLELG